MGRNFAVSFQKQTHKLQSIMKNTEQTSPSIEQQIADAEERGYRRGLNEQIEKKMQEPAVWEDKSPAHVENTTPPAEFQILGTRQPSIWD